MPEKKFDGFWGYRGGAALLAIILGFVTLRYFYQGIVSGGGIYYQITEAYLGLTIIMSSFVFFEFEPKAHWRRFLSFQGLFVVGTVLVAPSIQAGTPFSTTISFEVGSFALIVTGFFITSVKEEYHDILLYSSISTTVLFTAGMLSAFRDIAGSNVPIEGIGGATTFVITALFLIGSIDLTVLSVLLFGVVMRKVRHKGHSPAHDHDSSKPPSPPTSPFPATSS